MKACVKKLKSCLINVMEQEEDQLREELLHKKPHVFSAQFNQAMETAMQVHKSRSKLRSIVQFAAAVIVVILLTGGILLVSSDDLCASNFGVDILEWLEEFFTVDVNIPVDTESERLFDESQIGYMPEGFEKVGEEIHVNAIKYLYENSEGNTIWITVYKSTLGGQHDNVGAQNDVRLSNTGYEYSIVNNLYDGTIAISWIDDHDIYYKLIGNLEETELIKIMENISF